MLYKLVFINNTYDFLLSHNSDFFFFISQFWLSIYLFYNCRFISHSSYPPPPPHTHTHDCEFTIMFSSSHNFNYFFHITNFWTFFFCFFNLYDLISQNSDFFFLELFFLLWVFISKCWHFCFPQKSQFTSYNLFFYPQNSEFMSHHF